MNQQKLHSLLGCSRSGRIAIVVNYSHHGDLALDTIEGHRKCRKLSTIVMLTLFEDVELLIRMFEKPALNLRRLRRKTTRSDTQSSYRDVHVFKKKNSRE